MTKDNKVTISGTFLHQTVKSLIIEVEDIEISLPLSEITMAEEDYSRGDKIDIIILGWLARNRGLD